MQKKDIIKAIEITIATAAVIVAVIELIPMFGQWLLPRAPISTQTPPVAAVQPSSTLQNDRPMLPTETADTDGSVLLKEPDRFVRDYYAAINARQYDKTWSMLSTSFKDQHHCCNSDGSYQFAPYVEWWNSVQRVDVLRVATTEQNSNNAFVITDLRYHKTNGGIIDRTNVFRLVVDKERNGWLIDEQGY